MNAGRVLEVQAELGSLDAYLWAFVDGRPIVNRFADALGAARRRPTSRETISKDLKRRGFRFIGPTVCYAFMQTVGMVDDHTVDCFRTVTVSRLRSSTRAAATSTSPTRSPATGRSTSCLIHGFFSHLEIDWELPASRYVNERLGSFARLIRFDKRGTGLSDRTVGLARSRDAHGRRPRGDGRSRQRVGGALRLLGGRPIWASSSPRRIRSGCGRSSSTAPTRSGVIQTTTTRGRRRGTSGSQVAR